MKFLIEFFNDNLIKFRSFIRMCSKIFTKTGIILTIKKDNYIRVSPDPFIITEKFDGDMCFTKIVEIYKNIIFIEYPLISPNNNMEKNSTFHKLELKTTDNGKKINSSEENRILTFRITKEELAKLNELLQTNFLAFNQFTIKAIEIPKLIKNKPYAKNYKAFLSIFDKPVNATQSGILFKPLKQYHNIIDLEDEMDQIENETLGQFLYTGIIKTKLIRTFAARASKNFNKTINIYIYKEKDLKENNIKQYLYFSYLSNHIYFGKYIDVNNNEDNDEEYKYIYKLSINSDKLIKLLRYFNNDINNPDYISVWTKGLVVKTQFILRKNIEQPENNEENNFIDNEDNENDEDDVSYMFIKAFAFFENKEETIMFEGIDINDGLAKKNFVNKLIEDDVDEKHEELNKSLDLSDITGVVYRGDNSFMDEEEELNDDDDENNNKKKKKKKNTNKKEISEDNDNSDSNMYNIDESMENIDKNKNKKRTATKKGKSKKK